MSSFISMRASKEHTYARDSLTRMCHVGKFFHAKMLLNTKNATVGTRTSVVLQHDEPDQNIKYSTVAYKLLQCMRCYNDCYYYWMLLPSLPPPPISSAIGCPCEFMNPLPLCFFTKSSGRITIFVTRFYD